MRRVSTAAVVVVGVVALCGASAAAARVPVAVVQTTVSLSQGMTRLHDVFFGRSRPHGLPVINFDARAKYQRIQGFGGAITDTSAWLIEDQMSAAERANLLDDLFSRTGIHMTFMHLPMGATDFTRDGQPYSYDDLPPGQRDPRLAHFSIAHDEAYILPFLHQMLAIDPNASVLATPWSPPGWMKTNDALDNEQHSGTLLASDYEPLAQYFVKFLQAYAAAGVRIAAVTPANEPANPTMYPGLELPEPGEARFISDYLAPALVSAKLRVRIYGDDRGLDSGLTWAEPLSRSVPPSDMQGIAWHCYHGTPLAMLAEHNLYPRLDEIMSECSPGLDPSVSETVISSLRNWASAVVLYNLALDPQGGPVQPPNHGCPGCVAAATVDSATDDFSLNLNYFQLGQASHFIEPGAVRIATKNFVSYKIAGYDPHISTPGLDDVAVLNPDGGKVVLAYNNSSAPITFAVEWANRSFRYTLAPEATVTFAWDRR